MLVMYCVKTGVIHSAPNVAAVAALAIQDIIAGPAAAAARRARMELLMGTVRQTGSNTAVAASIARLAFVAPAVAATPPPAHERGSAFLVTKYDGTEGAC